MLFMSKLARFSYVHAFFLLAISPAVYSISIYEEFGIPGSSLIQGIECDNCFGAPGISTWLHGRVSRREAEANALIYRPSSHVSANYVRMTTFTNYEVAVSTSEETLAKLWELPDFKGIPIMMKWQLAVSGRGLGEARAHIESAWIAKDLTIWSNSDHFYARDSASGTESIYSSGNDAYNINLLATSVARVKTGCAGGRKGPPTYACIDPYYHHGLFSAYADPDFYIDPLWAYHSEFAPSISIIETGGQVRERSFGTPPPPVHIPAPASLWLLCIGLFALRISHGRKA